MDEMKTKGYDEAIMEGANMFIDFCSRVAAGVGSPSLSEMSPVSEDDGGRVKHELFTPILGGEEGEEWLSPRLDALRRYRKKKAKRSFRKIIRYECRKQTAIKRPRTKGRFVKVDK